MIWGSPTPGLDGQDSNNYVLLSYRTSYQSSVVTVQQPLQLVSPYTTTGNYYTWSVCCLL
jgi:hypothetical protein